jgi:hypothetical protein
MKQDCFDFKYRRCYGIEKANGYLFLQGILKMMQSMILFILLFLIVVHISADTYSFIVLARTEEIEENYIIKELILKKFIAAISSSTEWIGVFVLGITTGTITISLEATPESYNSLIGISIIIPC